MTLGNLVRYFVGHRESILAVARCPQAVWLGFVFVISAGFAREYDGEDLLHAPWHVLLPLGASLLTSFLLYLLLSPPRRLPEFEKREQIEQNSGRAPISYCDFLGLYWMTAPLAWVYAIPVERFLDAADAVRANLWLLGLVSVWRVVLMTRVVSVIYRHSIVTAFFLVMLFADTVAMVVIWLTPLPIVSIMGGIRLTESEQVLQSVGFFLRLFGVLTWPVWLIGSVVLVARSRKKQADNEKDADQTVPTQSVSWGLWGLAAVSILFWLPLLPVTQVEQINRRRAEVDLRAGRVAEALQFMSQRERDEFPPHWDPPPRVGYGEREPPLLEVLFAAERLNVEPWVRDLFRDKLEVQSQALRFHYQGHAIQLAEMDDAQLEEYVDLLQSMEVGTDMARYHQLEIQSRLEPDRYGGEERELSVHRRELLEAILQLIPEDERED